MGKIIPDFNIYLLNKTFNRPGKSVIYSHFKAYLSENYPDLNELSYQLLIKSFCEILGY
jgi:hypothetical protein